MYGERGISLTAEDAQPSRVYEDTAMNLQQLQANWHAFGATDPLWAILTSEGKEGGKWSPDEFFATGRAEITRLLARLAEIGQTPPRRKALDFGCGVGRLTQVLAENFEEVCGVDIAPSMVDLVRAYNKHGNRCRYYLNEVNDLRLFREGEFDLIYSNIVLQHMEPSYAANYVKEFIRLLTPEGVAVFLLPDSVEVEGRADRRTSRDVSAEGPVMEMYGTPVSDVVKLVRASCGRIIDIFLERDFFAFAETHGGEWLPFFYVAGRSSFLEQRRQAVNELTGIVPAHATFILVDQDEWATGPHVEGRMRMHFLERDGVYFGPPSNDDVAIEELERLRQLGASHMVFAWPAFWWLEYYAEFHRHLRSRFRCVSEGEYLVIFDLRGPR